MQVWYKRFKNISNTKIIYALKSSTAIEDFSVTYNLKEIYNNFKVFQSEDFTSDNVNLLFKQQIILKALKIIDFRLDFNKICKLYIRNK